MIDATSENLILGGILNGNKDAISASASLRVQDFDGGTQRVIFQAIQGLLGRGIKPDSINVAGSMNGSLDSVGGAPFLFELSSLDIDSRVSDYTSHIDKIREASLGRRVQRACKAFLEGEPSEDRREALLKELGASYASERPSGKSLAEYAGKEVDEGKTLLGNRFLCVEGGLLFVGPSGIGKSSASAQQDALWATGRPAFGINPSRALKILTVQAENDEGDMAEFAQGVLHGLSFTRDETEKVGRNTLYVSHKTSTGVEFIRFLRRCISDFRPDIVRIDPLQAYLGDDPKETRILTAFCRNMINPLLEEFQCAAILNHHTPKTNFRDTSKWSPVDWAYAGAGAADITNWARAVIIIDPCEDPHVFRFIGAKRGSRIGWADEVGDPVTERYFRHSKKAGTIMWEDVEGVPEDIAQKKRSKRSGTKEDLLSLVPLDEEIEKKALISKGRAMNIGSNRAYELIAELIHDGALFVRMEEREKVRPIVMLARFRVQNPVGCS